MLEISVIVPVYNAAPFVRKAVESALGQPETAEVILIEDGSPDDSLEVCKQLDAEYEKVMLFTHPNNENRGAGPSRNVGIANAKYDYIAFLDADDYFLSDRFRAERQIFDEQPDIDGVYGAAGSHYYTEEGKKRYSEHGYGEIVTVSKPIEPSELIFVLLGLRGNLGYFILDALTVRRDLLQRVGGFSEMRLHQDSEFIFKVAALGRLVGGSIVQPVVKIGIHDKNRIVAKQNNSYTQEVLFKRLYKWSGEVNMDSTIRRAINCNLKLSQIRGSNKVAAIARTIIACATDLMFVRNRTFVGGSVDFILNGWLVFIRNKFKGAH